MKKITIFVLFLFAISVASAQLEILPIAEEQQPQKEIVKLPKKSTGGSFYLAKEKSLFGLRSKQEGRGFGVPYQAVKNRPINLYYGSDVQKVTIKSDSNQGLKFFHLKKIPTQQGELLTLELLSDANVQQTEYTLIVKLPRDDNRFINGAVKLPQKSSKFDYYELKFYGKGIISIKE